MTKELSDFLELSTPDGRRKWLTKDEKLFLENERLQYINRSKYQDMCMDSWHPSIMITNFENEVLWTSNDIFIKKLEEWGLTDIKSIRDFKINIING